MQALILSHYPPVIKQIKEMRKIAQAEDAEFSKLNAEINKVARNMFVSTADEIGVQRFEKLFGITPEAGQSLKDRKICIISAMNRKKMSLSEFKTMLSDYLEDIALSEDIPNMEMIAEINIDESGSLDVINRVMDGILPLNVCCLLYCKAENDNGHAKAAHRHICRCRILTSEKRQQGISYRTRVEEKAMQQESVVMQHNAWRFDGTFRFDGSRAADAYFKEEKL